MVHFVKNVNVFSKISENLNCTWAVFMELHKCKFCRKSFNTAIQLRAHVTREHPATEMKGDKKECEICKKIVQRKSYSDHVARHDKSARARLMEINFQCRLCKDTFVNVQCLQRHVDCIHLGKAIKNGRVVSNMYRSKRPSSTEKKVIDSGDADIQTESNEDCILGF